MKRIITLAAIVGILFTASSCGSSRKGTLKLYSEFPAVGQEGKTAVVCHRGYWKSEAGGMSENSIASLKAAQDGGFWGSECDIHLTADNVVIVNHNNDIAGKKIATHKFADFAKDLLPNGERRPSLDEYLDQAAKCRTTKLIIEFKKQPSPEREDLLVEKTMQALVSHKLYDPSRVLFISFSQHICEKVAAEHPKFVNQFLSSEVAKDESPANYAKLGINGIDYAYQLFQMHRNWVSDAHTLGMSVNAWTVNKPKDIKDMISLGVDAITTNEPMLTRELLGDREYRNK